MTPLERQFALKKKGITQKQIAEKLGVCQMCVSDEINSRHISHRIREAIADAISEDVRLVFPEYYFRKPKRNTSKVAAL
jgi:transcriptional regulator with XRE-family HTH domain